MKVKAETTRSECLMQCSKTFISSKNEKFARFIAASQKWDAMIFSRLFYKWTPHQGGREVEALEIGGQSGH